MPEPTKQQETTYKILAKQTDDTWAVEGERTAASAQAAIKRFIDDAPDDGKAGTFLAIPVRSWNPLVATTQTKVEVTFGEATDTTVAPQPAPLAAAPAEDAA